MKETKNTTELKTRTQIMATLHIFLSNGIRAPKSIVPKAWLKEKGLTIESSHACFNSGQVHHHKEQSFKDELESIGFLKRSKVGINAGQIPYTVFGNFSIMFPLRNQQNEIVNFYAMGIKNEKTAYMNEEGIYPCYPNEQTKKIFIVDTILDAATLLESKVLDNKEAVIALYDGKMMPQHTEAISKLSELKEVVIIKQNKR